MPKQISPKRGLCQGLEVVFLEVLTIAGLCILLFSVSLAEAADKKNCLLCHKHRVGRIDENGKRWNYNVDEARPGSLITEIWPPCCSTSLLVIANPSPVPFLLVVKKGWKILSRSLLSMPFPESEISTAIDLLPGRRQVDTLI
jgi:hypothetical protein